MNQRAVLADLDLGRAVGNTGDGCALVLVLQRGFGQYLGAGNLRTGQHRVVEADLPGLQHRLLFGKGALGVGVQVGGARPAVLPGLDLPAAHDPVTGVKADLGVGRAEAAVVVAELVVQAGQIVVEQQGLAAGLVAGDILLGRAQGIGGHHQGQVQGGRVLLDHRLRVAFDKTMAGGRPIVIGHHQVAGIE